MTFTDFTDLLDIQVSHETLICINSAGAQMAKEDGKLVENWDAVGCQFQDLTEILQDLILHPGNLTVGRP